MKIAVNTRFLIPGKLEGIGWFTYETMKRITSLHSEHEFIFIFDRLYDKSFIFSNNITPVVVYPPARHPFLWFAFFEISLPMVISKYKPDILVSTDGFLSLNLNLPSVLVMHDLNYEHLPHMLPRLTRLHYRKFLRRYAQKASRIVTVSEFSKYDIVSTYQIDPSYIDVAPNGAADIYKPVGYEIKEQVWNRYTSGKEYLLFVGALHPRKNIVRLLQAYDLFKKETDNNIKLVIVGEKMFSDKDIEQTYRMMHFNSDVVFTGRLSQSELHRVTASALAMVYVPCYEGFGIPALEAMKCGTPLIASNITAIPEVVGNAALFADPYSILSIKNAINEIVANSDLRNRLSQKGIERAKNFSWDKTASILWESIDKVLSGI